MTVEVTPPGRYDIALDCVHCGLCLPVCPTYLHLGNEADSPRGRIYLMRAHDEGRQALTPGFAQHLDLCLVCRACETACPSGVHFGSMMEDFRAQLHQQPPGESRSWSARLRAALGRRILLDVLPHRRRLRALADALYLYRTSGLAKLLRRTRFLRLVGLEEAEAMSPEVPSPAMRRDWAERLPAHGTRRARILFLRGCVTPELLPEMQSDSIAVLRHHGCEVWTPPQTCCGALHFHTGERERGLVLLEANVRAFDLREVDAVVVNAAGCGSTLKEYGHLAAGRPDLMAPAAAVAARVRDISEFLHDLGPLTPSIAVPLRVAYDDPCHLLHGQGIADAPRALLGSIPGLTLVPLGEADRCCGSAGIYNVAHPELSDRILDEKVRHIAASGADVVATGNPGCILQIRRGLRRAAAREPRLAGVGVVHPMTLLAHAHGLRDRRAAWNPAVGPREGLFSARK